MGIVPIPGTERVSRIREIGAADNIAPSAEQTTALTSPPGEHRNEAQLAMSDHLRETAMKAAHLRRNGDIEVVQRRNPVITDAVMRVVPGSALRYHRGATDFGVGDPIGREPIGVIEQVGANVTTVKPGGSRSSHRSPTATAPARRWTRVARSSRRTRSEAEPAFGQWATAVASKPGRTGADCRAG